MAEIARLARLELTGTEKESLGRDLLQILDYVETLASVETQGVEPTAHVATGDATGMRPDEVAEGLSHTDALANAPEATDGFFAVPRILEGDD